MRKPWSKAKVRRVIESVHAGGCSAHRTDRGWVVWLTDSGAPNLRNCYLVPLGALRSRHKWWLGNRMIRALRETLDGLEGTKRIGAAEARELVRWCVRWVPRRRSTDDKRAAAARRKVKPQSVAEMVQRAGYLAERSRRGWVVRLSSQSSRRLRGHYLVPFRALRSERRRWRGSRLIAGLQDALQGLHGLRRISPSEESRMVR